jgi:uncharacterized membrane protein YfcA
MSLLLAVAAGALIGLSLGALGGGGSILAVPVLVYLLDQSANQATTGSLVVVATTSLIGAVTAHRAGHVLLGPGSRSASSRSAAPPSVRRHPHTSGPTCCSPPSPP